MQYKVMVAGSLGALLSLASTGVFLVSQKYTTPPPFYFTQEMYAPERSAVCPGDVLRWRPSLVVTRVPTVLAVARTIWDASNGRTLQSDAQLDFFVWTEAQLNSPVSRPTEFLIPKSLPAGVYEIRAGASAFNSDAAAYRVPFVIPDDCPAQAGG